MRLRDFLNTLNCQVSYRVIDRFTREIIPVSAKDKVTLNRTIYMVFNSENPLKKLDIYLF